MATEENAQSPFTRPAFIISAVVVGVILVLGIVLAAVNMGRSEPEAAPTTPAPPTTKTTEPAAPSPTEGNASVCGLDGEVLSGSISTAPDTEWEYQGTIAYPSSSTYGPGATDASGVRSCFQHSPEGAVVAAANAVVQGSDPSTATEWIEYFLAEDVPGRDELVSEVPQGTQSDIRMNIAGFRMLSYEGDTARVDIALRAVGSGETVYGSIVYDLVWENGDWKLLPENTSNPLRLAQIPDPAGYITWGEQSQ